MPKKYGRIARCIFNGQAQREYLNDATWLTFKVKDGIVYFKPSSKVSNNAIELEELPDGHRTIDVTKRLLGGHSADVLRMTEASYMLLHEAERGWIRLEYIQGARPKVPCCRVYALKLTPKAEVIINPVQHIAVTHRVVLDAFAKVHEYEIANRLSRKRRPRDIQEAVKILSTFQSTVSEMQAMRQTRSPHRQLRVVGS
jgi:hypothetical protein